MSSIKRIENNTLLVFPAYFSVSPMAFDDIIKCQNVYTATTAFRPVKCSFLNPLKRIHLSCRVNNICCLPYKHLWDYTNVMNKALDLKTIIIFAGALWEFDDSVLRSFKRIFPSVEIYIFFWDSIKGPYLKLYEKAVRMKSVNRIFTFDPMDAKRFGITYTGLCYYSMHEIQPAQVTSDVYFIATPRERLDFIKACYRKLSSGSSCTFKLFINDSTILPEDGIQKIETSIPYLQILQEIQSYNCILEIVKEGQSGPTLRYFEAVCYNKKLLTNNPEIVNFPFYDERYMKIFHAADDIDVEWVARREPVDYHYDGSFSPIHLIELIDKLRAEEDIQTQIKHR